jgi:ABC-type uncharacterized transport system substrate-binding protein
MTGHVGRREFITLCGGATIAWPLAARAQQPGERVRRVGILMPYPQTEQEIQGRVRAFKEELHRLGWIEGSKIEFDERWTADDMELVRSSAASLVERNPDAIVALGGRVIPILKQTTRSVPLVVMTADLIGTAWSRAWRIREKTSPAFQYSSSPSSENSWLS